MTAPAAPTPDGPREVSGGRQEQDEQAGDVVCWLDRVCDACGGLSDGPPVPVCPRCGARRDRS